MTFKLIYKKLKGIDNFCMTWKFYHSILFLYSLVFLNELFFFFCIVLKEVTYTRDSDTNVRLSVTTNSQ